MWKNRALYYGNRAAAYMMSEKFVLAANDCESALVTDPTMVKMHVRRARCYLRLGMFEESEDIVNKVFDLKEVPGDIKATAPDQDIGAAKQDASKCKGDITTARTLSKRVYADDYTGDIEGMLRTR
jgi:hypothetical protein